MTNDIPTPEMDPTLAVAERQLAMLGELADLAMGLSRAFAASAAASANAEETILADKFFMPEIGRARACGAKDAAESFQKVSRAVRLTLKLEMTVAETVRDIRAGIVTHSEVAHRKDARENADAPADGPRPLGRSAGSCSNDRDTDFGRLENDTERLVEFERPETLPRAPFRETVDGIRADLGATIDWTRWKIEAPTLCRPAPSADFQRRGPPTAR